ncbi:MAG: Mor transcription activator family protein [Candidatus Thiodiazotropha taylori]
MKKELQSKGPELLADLRDHAEAVFLAMTDIDADTAGKIARELTDRMRSNWGGQLIYFPKGDSIEIAERDLQMYDDFTGKNHDELARKYNISVQQVYKRLRIVQQSEFAKTQPDMFDSKG